MASFTRLIWDAISDLQGCFFLVNGGFRNVNAKTNDGLTFSPFWVISWVRVNVVYDALVGAS